MRSSPRASLKGALPQVIRRTNVFQTGYLRRIIGTAFVVYLTAAALCAAPLLAEDVEKARELNARAIQSYKAKKYLEAIDYWLQACDSASSDQLVKLHKNLGLALQKLERLPEAWFHLTRYMQRADKVDAKVAKKIKAIEEKLSKIHVKVRLNSQPAGAMAVLPPGDRMHRVKTPFTWWLPPGEYAVELTLEGYVISTEKVRVERDGQDNFLFVLKTQPRTGTIRLTGEAEGSDVRVAGKSRGPLPFEADLAPGKYDLQVFYESGQSWEAEAEIEVGKTVEMKVVVGKSVVPPVTGGTQEKKPVWQWVTFGSGAAVAIVGGILLGVGYNAASEAKSDMDQAGDMTAYNDAYDRWTTGRNEAYAGYVLLGVGGAAVLGGAIGLMVHAGGDNRHSSVSWSPILGPDQAGFSMELTF